MSFAPASRSKNERWRAPEVGTRQRCVGSIDGIEGDLVTLDTQPRSQSERIRKRLGSDGAHVQRLVTLSTRTNLELYGLAFLK